MNMRFILLTLFVVAASGCQSHRLTKKAPAKETAQPTATTTVQIHPGSPMTVPLPDGSSTLREVIAKARSMSSEEELIRYMSTDTKAFGLTETNLVSSLSAGNWVVVVRGRNRIFVPSVLASESVLGNYPVDSATTVLSVPEQMVNNGEFWSDPQPETLSVQYRHEGDQISMSSVGSTFLNNLLIQMRDSNIKRESEFYEKMTTEKVMVAVIHRESGEYHDQLIVPTSSEHFQAGSESKDFVVLSMATHLVQSIKLRDGDIVELSRLELLPVTAIAIAGIR